jgi:hypothetical protein
MPGHHHTGGSRRIVVSSGAGKATGNLIDDHVAARVNDIAASLIAEQALSDAVVGDTARARGELQQAIGPKSGAGGFPTS